LGAKVCRGIGLSVAAFSNQLLQGIAGVLREDYAAVQRIVPALNCLVRGADALHLAVASRSNITHFASLDKAQRIAAGHWLRGIACVPEI
jgi:predicted nucleic acid-binding protein